MTTNFNKNLDALNTLLDSLENDFNKGFAQLYKEVKFRKTEPKIIEKALNDYYNITVPPYGLLPDTQILCKFPTVKLEDEIINNLSFNVSDKGQIFYRKKLIKTAKKVGRFIDIINKNYRPMPSEIELIFKEQKYHIKTYTISLSSQLKYISDALYKLYNVIYDINATWADDNSKTTTPQSQGEQQPVEISPKLQWICKPAIAGYIISELIRNRYIEPPIRRGDPNLKELARICDQIFIFKDYKPGVDGWRNNVDESRNELTEIPRTKLKLPDLDQLS